MSDFTKDIDVLETQEWLEAFEDVVSREGADRAKFLFEQLLTKSSELGIESSYAGAKVKSYINSIDVSNQPAYPGDIELEKRIEAINRWNSTVIVAAANKKDGSIGGHIGTGAGAMTLYEIGFNHFWKAPNENHAGDLIFYQGHLSPIVYARSFLEGRISSKQLDNFRKQAFDGDNAVSSYPHPYLQPTYWQFPTVSMGLGPLQAIYQARFMKYLEARGLAKTSDRRVWAFCGDGEMDEPESIGSITRAGREGLDNLIFVVNCNLQRLDGLVNGNGNIVEELAGVFEGAGWNVIKVLWSSDWDKLLADQKAGKKLADRLSSLNDGQFHTIKAHGAEECRKVVFSGDEDLEALAKDMSDADIAALRRGGHDPLKVFAAYKKATEEANGKPTLILPMTVKGYGLGEYGESKNIAHNVKKLDTDALEYIKERFDVPATKDDVENYKLIKLDEDSKEMKYLHSKRKTLGGYIPARRENNTALEIPNYQDFAGKLLEDSGEREFSTTTAFVRMLTHLAKDKKLGKHLVPITVDESRTFGMEGLFRQLGIYNPKGQQYVPEDKKQVMFYKEAVDGQILQEGINEQGGFCSWIAAATSYSVHNVPMIPFMIYYSMFGFQRFGDLAWAAGDSMAKGFVIGGTAGRTTLNGEGLQHEDGHSHIQAGLIPNCVSYDPTYAYELAVILDSGMKRMYVDGDKVYYYITVMNENYTHRAMPEGSEEGIIKGLYKLEDNKPADKHVQLMGSGTILKEVEAAAVMLKDEYGITSNIWSMTSSNELYREAKNVARENMLHPTAEQKESYVTKCFKNEQGPVIASTDYIKLYTDQLREFIPNTLVNLGTDGFGRSDTRAALRSFFEVDRYHVVVAALYGLAKEGKVKDAEVEKAIKKYNIDPERLAPLYS
ncbi:pyruvate dehydrogenase (acetyl-transferring), homodimeric type [Francisella adeliensis]|uniref:Pyruvate dehydrogenase E1 component n=1 Tax=Francisella adeliensis TaxID=2007306 RepID=A0A2Z4XY35_9GAMM|nr:pyruvate dehydrogenase (acetyl-transferring), homodimeric type [Francisella adeliensis]AXA33353.1 pyruvate dehydrogenase (acetyl-transferring), homodimeric type [Francisella adeliensis]MBK2085365.1 pyruvate dehydrogenase (acetyl-transferring), homodimeric type [Francisella adeliensis]MBK2097095.1 pyruvate dehydrogenase (acetyl-transferring), homodimeric type [Francisella adeliensis]QIW12933.1 pyruvate dehydrogenase (acetyl-transferring), homodimeric type [Francisella adeliensis]QIW13456.1 p